MQTKRTISNIAYNTHEHFESVIKGLLQRKVIDWCYWIHHEPDTDETKPHTHFVLAPSARLDTNDLRKQFNEIDPTGNGLYLSCTSKWFFTTSMDDWLLYAVHDPYYLASKGQMRNIQYDYADLRTTDEDALRNDWNNINRVKYQRLQFLWDAVKRNLPFSVLVQQGYIPIAQRAQFEHQYNGLVQLFLSGEANRFLSHENADNDGVITDDQGADGSAIY